MKNHSKLLNSRLRRQSAKELIANGIKALRKKLGLTQCEMALKAGISERSLRRYENKEVIARGMPFLKVLWLCPDAESLRVFGINVGQFPAR